ncbi:LysR family transcriptional regulator [Ferrimonas sp.]|uniref:LysR family transcriptional regulator n=1 Tax=Ferrimonas sp. TaxID=2080861 RepID=UPI003A8E8EE8
MNLKELDLQTLTIFCELHRRGSATEVAQKMGLSNSRVSRRLSVLRELFQDELFVRRNHTLVATGRAKDLLPLCQQMLDNFKQMAGLCTEPAQKAPSHSGRRAYVGYDIGGLFLSQPQTGLYSNSTSSGV